jgi:hypothetical protein
MSGVINKEGVPKMINQDQEKAHLRYQESDLRSVLEAGHQIYEIQYKNYLREKGKDHDRDRGRNDLVAGFMPWLKEKFPGIEHKNTLKKYWWIGRYLDKCEAHVKKVTCDYNKLAGLTFEDLSEFARSHEPSLRKPRDPNGYRDFLNELTWDVCNNAMESVQVSQRYRDAFLKAEYKIARWMHLLGPESPLAAEMKEFLEQYVDPTRNDLVLRLERALEDAKADFEREQYRRDLSKRFRSEKLSP